jgi:hypothetical protein
MTEVFSAALINIKVMCDCVILKFSSKIAWYYWMVHAYCCTLFPNTEEPFIVIL